MTADDYQQRIKQIDDDALRAKNRIAKEFALTHNPVKLNDIITDGHTTIVVDEIRWSYGHGTLPYCVYHGTKLTKAGAPFKSSERAVITQGRLNESRN